MAGGGGGTSTSIQIPMEGPVKQYVEQTLPYLQAAQARAPLEQFLDPQVRQVVGLSPLQQWGMLQTQAIPLPPGQTQLATSLLAGIPGQAGQQVGVSPYETQGLGTIERMVGQAGRQVGMQSPEEAALTQLAQLTGGPLGSSPVTQAGLQAFEQIQAPAIQNTLNAMGMGRSGAGAEQIALARAAALTPLLQQEMQTRAAAVPQYLGLGQQLAGRETEQIGRTMQALGQQAGAQMGLGGAEAGRMEAAINRLLQGTIGAAGQLGTLGQQERQALTTAAGLGGAQGAVEQQTAQAALDAPLQDWLRRQGLAGQVTTLGGVPYQSPTTTTTQSPRSGFFGKSYIIWWLLPFLLNQFWI